MLVKPTFIGIGVAKSGTTTLFEWMRQHPDVYLPAQKELHFFNIDARYNKGMDYYLDNFSNAGKYPVRGDMTPGYFEKAERVVGRISKNFKNELKFILILRNPVARAYSHYLHMKCHLSEEETFEKALELENERLNGDPDRWVGYFSDGLYADKLELWIQEFGRESILVLLTEDLKNYPDVTFNKVSQFLGLSTAVNINFSEKKIVASEPRSMLGMQLLEHPPRWLLNAAKIMLPKAFRRQFRQKLRLLNRKPLSKPEIELGTRNKLIQLYENDVRRTSQIIGRDLSHWLSK